MSWELVYTSVPQGLKPGSRGFCAVAQTRGIPAALLERLESLSGYRHLFAPQDPNARLNPPAWSHLLVNLSGKRYHLLSYVGDAGLDYSQRTNKLAHHVACEPMELTPAGPAGSLQQPGFLLTQWQSEPAQWPAGRALPRGETRPGPCANWQRIAGDAGWAGVLADTIFNRREVNVIFQPGMPVLNLFAEAIALLPPPKRWEATFQTFYTGLPQGVDCRWRGIVAGSDEEALARRNAGALLIDLTRPQAAPPGAAASAAREGRLVEPLKTLETSPPPQRPANVPLAQTALQPAYGQRTRTAYVTAPQADLNTYEPQPLDGVAGGPPGLNAGWDPRYAQQGSRGRKWMIVTAVVGLVVLLGAGGSAIWVLKNQKSSNLEVVNTPVVVNQVTEPEQKAIEPAVDGEEAKKKKEAEAAEKRKQEELGEQAKKKSDFQTKLKQVGDKLGESEQLRILAEDFRKLDEIEKKQPDRKSLDYLELAAKIATVCKSMNIKVIDIDLLSEVHAGQENPEYEVSQVEQTRIKNALFIRKHKFHEEKLNFAVLAESLKADLAKKASLDAWNKVPAFQYFELKPKKDGVVDVSDLIKVPLTDEVFRDLKIKVYANTSDFDYVVDEKLDKNNIAVIQKKKKTVRTEEDVKNLLIIRQDGKQLKSENVMNSSQISEVKNAFLMLEYAGINKFVGFQKIDFQPAKNQKYTIQNNQIVIPLESLIESFQVLEWVYDKAGYVESDELVFRANIKTVDGKSTWKKFEGGSSYASITGYDDNRERIAIDIATSTDPMKQLHQLRIDTLKLLEYKSNPQAVFRRSFADASASLFANYISRCNNIQKKLTSDKKLLEDLQKQKNMIESGKGKDKDEKLKKFNQEYKLDLERLPDAIKYSEQSLDEMELQWPKKFMDDKFKETKSNSFPDFIKNVILSECLRDHELRINVARHVKFKSGESITIPLPLQ